MEPIQESLKELVGYGGDSLVADPDLLQRTLATRHSSDGQRIQWLVTAQRAGVVRRLREIDGLVDPELASKFVQYLALAEKMNARDAKWTVETWLMALGKAQLPPVQSTLNVAPVYDTDDDLLAPIPGSPSLAGPRVLPASVAPPPSWGASIQPPMWPQARTALSFGDENSSGTKGIVPSEVEASGFNWGGAVLTPFWLYANNLQVLGIALLVGGLFVPGLGLIAGVYYGFRGNFVAWQNRRFDNVAQFREVQKAWTKAAGIVTVFGVLIMIVAALSFLPAIVTRATGAATGM